jgi:hypothetical protein
MLPEEGPPVVSCAPVCNVCMCQAEKLERSEVLQTHVDGVRVHRCLAEIEPLHALRYDHQSKSIDGGAGKTEMAKVTKYAESRSEIVRTSKVAGVNPCAST